jgi:hypothetical protein
MFFAVVPSSVFGVFIFDALEESPIWKKMDCSDADLHQRALPDCCAGERQRRVRGIHTLGLRRRVIERVPLAEKQSAPGFGAMPWRCSDGQKPSRHCLVQ